MIGIFFTILLIIVFILTGKFIPAFKKLIQFITKMFLKLLSLLGITFTKKEKKLELSKDFKNTYKEIKVMRKSKSNLKPIPYIDWLNLIIAVVSLILIIVNLGYISDNIISKFLFNIQPVKFIKTVADVNTLFTAAIFSILSFSFSKILSRWKETKIYRTEKKNKKLKEKAKELFTSKELIETAKEKDNKKYKELK